MKKELNIIMIEDTPSDVDLIQHELKKGKISFKAEVVSSESSFVTLLDKYTPDIILSDFSMPSFDGLSALKIAQEKKPEVPFVFVSGTIGEERAIEALKSGATDYILKDHLTGLVPKLKRALNEAKERLERIEAEKRLKKSEKQLAEAQEVARIGSWEFNLENNSLSWSNEMYRILGFSQLETYLTPETFLSCIHPEDKPSVIALREKSYREAKSFSYSVRIIRQDNRAIRWIFLKAKFKLDEQGIPKKVFGIVQDITELRQAEERLKQTNKALMTFIYKASHDLRGPISSAIGLCNMGIEDSRDFPGPRHYFELMNNSLQKLDNIILSLIEVMSIKDGKAKKEKVNFNELIEEALSQLQHTKGFSRIKFHRDILCPHIYSDPRMLASIIQNLIENAVKYQNYNNPEPEVRIQTVENNGVIQIKIADNGIGIDDHVKDHVFDMFFRGHMSSNGSGLGLYIVRNAVEMLNGTIRLESAPGEGTTFTIEFPTV